MAKLLFFASLRERLGCDSEQLDLPPDICTISELKSLLTLRGDHWAEAFNSSSLLVSVDQQMANAQSIINNDAEIAFFPPVTGG